MNKHFIPIFAPNAVSGATKPLAMKLIVKAREEIIFPEQQPTLFTISPYKGFFYMHNLHVGPPS